MQHTRPRSAPGAPPRIHPPSRCSWPRAHSSAATRASQDQLRPRGKGEAVRLCGRTLLGVLQHPSALRMLTQGRSLGQHRFHQLAFAKKSELTRTLASKNHSGRISSLPGNGELGMMSGKVPPEAHAPACPCGSAPQTPRGDCAAFTSSGHQALGRPYLAGHRLLQGGVPTWHSSWLLVAI